MWDRWLDGTGGGETVCGGDHRCPVRSALSACLARRANAVRDRRSILARAALSLRCCFGGGLIERGGLRGDLQGDSLAVDFVGPFAVRAMALGGVAMAVAVGVAAPLQSLS